MPKLFHIHCLGFHTFDLSFILEIIVLLIIDSSSFPILTIKILIKPYKSFPPLHIIFWVWNFLFKLNEIMIYVMIGFEWILQKCSKEKHLTFYAIKSGSLQFSFWLGQTTKEQLGKTQKVIMVSSRCLR